LLLIVGCYVVVVVVVGVELIVFSLKEKGKSKGEVLLDKLLYLTHCNGEEHM